ncbi:metalloregulator ArsR/SmtB family transcription factor [Marinobacter koreensis]|uniref:Metalloregulator ArsR/SmtB family transcription factor n=1 Tax=Marinobacter koreensis TaxID=335974 RepID=A0ABW0RKU3_9GAMM|nr:metalloregulator ArsR/SmtB family transcription factor [Marinobacter koreensis]MCK7547784.1 metalloregulator ArsR/SmtB family transcription factor [Marinobacter koreensis]
MRRRVLFVCTANSARSLMAEALLRDIAGNSFDVASAGTRPGSPHPLAVQVLAEAGIPTEALASKPVSQVTSEHWDYVITLCDQAARDCDRSFPGAQKIAWDCADPVPDNQYEGFLQTFRELRERIGLFVLVHQKQATTRTQPYDPVSVFKALGDDRRLTMALLIRDHRELCVCELTAALGESQPKISRHLATLREVGLLSSERRGQWIHYRLHPDLPHWVLRILNEAAEASRDRIGPELHRLAKMEDRPVREPCA